MPKADIVHGGQNPRTADLYPPPVAGSEKKPVAVCGSRFIEFEQPNLRRRLTKGPFD